jgi:K+-sensing histidine kinase KdpD
MFAGGSINSYADVIAELHDPEGIAPPLGVHGGPIVLRTRHEPERWIEVATYPVADRSTQSEPRDETILVIRDVTEQRQREAVRETFIGVLSHELRTPITTIYAGSRLLSRRLRRRGGPPPEQIAADINDEASRLYDLVEDLLALTRVERELLETTDEPVSLPRAIDVAIRTVSARSPDVPIIAAGAIDPPAVRGDSDYVEHALRNLLASSIRFAGRATPVIVRVEPGQGEVAVRVLDRRADASPEELSMSFALVDEPAAPSRLRLGIPLFVVRRLVEAMGGRVWARPRPDGGAELGFSLPAYADAD